MISTKQIFRKQLKRGVFKKKGWVGATLGINKNIKWGRGWIIQSGGKMHNIEKFSSFSPLFTVFQIQGKGWGFLPCFSFNKPLGSVGKS